MSNLVESLSNSKTPNVPNWCPGCGDFGIWSAFKLAAQKKGWDSSNSAIVAGIGCHGHMVNFVQITAFEGLHGRSLPVASGIKMANNNLNVFSFSGDGDSLAEGCNHFVHTARRNHDITLILHDNAVYGLTTGQTSPRSPKGYVSKSTPAGSVEEPLNPLTMAIASGATFVAREYAGNIEQISELLIAANEHRGFSLVVILQPCVTFNHMYTHYFFQKNTYYLDKTHDITNKLHALEKSMEWDLNKIPLGIFYKVESPSYEDQIPVLQSGALGMRNIEVRNISDLYKGFA
ncbi:2-oxoacid:ferredoxin oxidoreductase subunit beta [candidate division WWE3 bacterium]|uniref:2-oxoacid:ferredoxin oxidoreductase subunit beta n=1 Tax=candidate division WWE3 bacterium TaxID=2053526 RepID=A0A955ECC0_UNCKA|nr:2-oxoacid:ferredoxin oxidoreductase subunit beta [candidate division WWE3 bacterium]